MPEPLYTLIDPWTDDLIVVDTRHLWGGDDDANI